MMVVMCLEQLRLAQLAAASKALDILKQDLASVRVWADNRRGVIARAWDWWGIAMNNL